MTVFNIFVVGLFERMDFRRVNHVMLVPTWGTMVTTVVTNILVLLAVQRWYDSQQLWRIKVIVIHVQMLSVLETKDESPQYYSPILY